MDCDMEDPLTSFFNAAPPPSVGPILRAQSSSSSCKGVYKSCLNYKLATEKRAAAPIAVGVKSCVYSKQDGIGEYRGEFVCSRRYSDSRSVCSSRSISRSSSRGSGGGGAGIDIGVGGSCGRVVGSSQ